MTEAERDGPLIDRDAIATAMYLTPYHPDWQQCVWLADAVVAHLQGMSTYPSPPDAGAKVIGREQRGRWR